MNLLKYSDIYGLFNRKNSELDPKNFGFQCSIFSTISCCFSLGTQMFLIEQAPSF